MKTSQLRELRDQVLTGKLDAVVMVAILDKVITELITKLEMANDALLDAPCTCRPHAIRNSDGTTSNYKCLRCRALEE